MREKAFAPTRAGAGAGAGAGAEHPKGWPSFFSSALPGKLSLLPTAYNNDACFQ